MEEKKKYASDGQFKEVQKAEDQSRRAQSKPTIKTPVTLYIEEESMFKDFKFFN